MTTSLSNHGASERPGDGFEEDPSARTTPTRRGCVASPTSSLTDRLMWLAWYQPGIFTAVMDYMEFSEALAADIDPASPYLDTADHDGEHAPPTPGRGV